MYLAISINAVSNPRVLPQPDLLAKSLSTMWTRLVLYLHVLFQTHALLFSSFSSANSTFSSNVSTSTLSGNFTALLSTTSSTVTDTQSTPSLPASATANSSIITLPTLPSASKNAASTSSPTSTSSQPTQSIDPSTLDAILTMQSRRFTSIIGAISSPKGIPAWLVT